MSGNYEKAKQLASRHYVVMVFRNPTTDGEGYVFEAYNPEISGCKAQGLTLEEAKENLDEVRIDMIEHLLDFDLPVPSPGWGSYSITNELPETDFEQIESDSEEVLYNDALLKT